MANNNNNRNKTNNSRNIKEKQKKSKNQQIKTNKKEIIKIMVIMKNNYKKIRLNKSMSSEKHKDLLI